MPPVKFAAVITFATTYALILPAITVEKNNADAVSGMYLESVEKQGDDREANAGNQTDIDASQIPDGADLTSEIKLSGENVNRYNGGKTPIAKTSTLEAHGYSVTRIQSTNGTVDETEAANDTVTGTIDEANKRYYNQFTNTLGFAADAELMVTKHLDGYEWTGERYYFTLTAGAASYTDGVDPTEGTSPMPNSNRIYISSPSGTEDKTYTFGKIRYIRPGTYTYTIAETDAAGNVLSAAQVAEKIGMPVDAEGAEDAMAESGIAYYNQERRGVLDSQDALHLPNCVAAKSKKADPIEINLFFICIILLVCALIASDLPRQYL